jgi:hypothetical protein
MAKGTKNINIEISIDCWKKLKIISISKDMTLQDVVREVLEKHVTSKRVNNDEVVS